MRLRDRDEHLDPRTERELDAVDRALAGEPVDPDLAAWAELTTLLAEERPEPSERWSAELDRRVASRFGRDDAATGSPHAVGARLRELPPRRIATPLGALATLAIVAVVATSTLDGGGSGGGDSQTASDSGTGSGAFQTQEAAPGDAGSLNEAAPSADQTRSSGAAAASAGQGKIAPGTRQRQIDRDVTLTLTTPPEDVRDTADEAIAITRDLDGVVASSQVSKSGKRARATLELTVPTRNLDTALDRLTGLANVRELNESTLDITRPFVSAQNRVRDARAERAKLLQALGNASTDAEADALRLQIKDARRTIARAEARFENVARRARLSSVSMTIAGDSGPVASDGGRTIGGWIDDAVSVLRDLAGVLLIAAAIVVPLALLLAIAWFATAALRRHRRERALDA